MEKKQLDVQREAVFSAKDPKPGYDVRLGWTSYTSVSNFDGPNFQNGLKHCDTIEHVAALVVGEFENGNYDRISLPLSGAWENRKLREEIGKSLPNVRFASVSDRMQMAGYYAIDSMIRKLEKIAK